LAWNVAAVRRAYRWTWIDSPPFKASVDGYSMSMEPHFRTARNLRDFLSTPQRMPWDHMLTELEGEGAFEAPRDFDYLAAWAAKAYVVSRIRKFGCGGNNVRRPRMLSPEHLVREDGLGLQIRKHGEPAYGLQALAIVNSMYVCADAVFGGPPTKQYLEDSSNARLVVRDAYGISNPLMPWFLFVPEQVHTKKDQYPFLVRWQTSANILVSMNITTRKYRGKLKELLTERDLPFFGGER